MPGLFSRGRPVPTVNVPRPRGPRVRGGTSNMPSQIEWPDRNTMTGAQLLELSYKERRTLRKRQVNTARYERRVIHAELLRRAAAERRADQEVGA